jgi:hypothetical protein
VPLWIAACPTPRLRANLIRPRRPSANGSVRFCVEGVDGLRSSLRQDLTVENAKSFLDVVLEKMPYHPKEALYLAQWITRNGQDAYEPVRAALQAELGGFIHHSPPPPGP